MCLNDCDDITYIVDGRNDERIWFRGTRCFTF